MDSAWVCNTESSAPDKRLSNQTECRSAQARHFLHTVIPRPGGKIGDQFGRQPALRPTARPFDSDHLGSAVNVSVAAKGNHWINAGGAARWDVPGEDGHGA